MQSDDSRFTNKGRKYTKTPYPPPPPTSSPHTCCFFLNFLFPSKLISLIFPHVFSNFYYESEDRQNRWVGSGRAQKHLRDYGREGRAEILRNRNKWAPPRTLHEIVGTTANARAHRPNGLRGPMKKKHCLFIVWHRHYRSLPSVLGSLGLRI